MTSLSEWLAYLEQLHPKTIDLGLGRVATVAQRLLPAAPAACMITVGGTNGKGSTCTFLEQILLQAGYQVGVYASPHLLHYHERVRINGLMTEDSDWVQAFELVNAARGNISLSYFEFGTLAAMVLFYRAALDVVILEVGLGGRLDAVNVWDADCAIVTNVDLDHMEYLGNTRELIAREKAGIFRHQRPAICGERESPLSLRAVAQEIGAEWIALGEGYTFRINTDNWDFIGATEWSHLPFPRLYGAHQINNAATALAALAALKHRLPIDECAIRQGLLSVQLLGRFQQLPGLPHRILDVAHNPHGVKVLADALQSLPRAEKTWAVVAMLKDKDILSVMREIKAQIDVWLVASLDLPRGATALYLQQQLIALGVSQVSVYTTPVDAWRFACSHAAENDRIIAFGSFHTVADLLQAEDNQPTGK